MCNVPSAESALGRAGLGLKFVAGADELSRFPRLFTQIQYVEVSGCVRHAARKLNLVDGSQLSGVMPQVVPARLILVVGD